MVASTGDTGAFLGEDLPTYLLLAFGGAMLVGSLLALFRPPPGTDGTAERPPLARTLVMAGIGAIAFVWALASLLRG